MGTNGAGIILRRPDGTFRIFKHDSKNPNSICGNSITKIYKDEKDNLWIGTDRGLSFYNGKNFKNYYYNDKANSLSSSNILSLFIDSKKRIWVGTKGGGLNYFDIKAHQFYSISEKDGLSNNVIQAIQEDNSGDLWLSTNKGLTRISFKNDKLPLEKNNFTIFNYFVEDGLQSNQFLTGSSNKNSKGELFFGGINGVSYFNPEKIQKNNHKPTVVFTDFLIRNQAVSLKDENSPLDKSINETEEITLTYDQAFITIKHLEENEIIADYKDSENIDGYFEQQPVAKSTISLDKKRELILSNHEGETPVMLIVEDNTEVMEFLVSHFQEKFIVHQAPNGKEGIDKALEIMPDIIISDVMMPVTSGIILCNTLKKDNRTSHIPIILLTARTPIIYKIEGLETGADDYITKPFSINVVETRV